MDLSPFFKNYTPEQKNVFTAFAITWPLSFSTIFAYVPVFRDLNLPHQLILSASATFIVVGVAFFLTSIYNLFLGAKKNLDIQLLSLPGFMSSSYLLLRPNEYELGYKRVIDIVYSSLYVYSVTLVLVIIIVLVAKYVIKRYYNISNSANKHNKRR
jgi:hypothetical protein